MKIRLLSIVAIIFTVFSCTEINHTDTASSLNGAISELGDGASSRRTQAYTSTLIGNIGENQVELEINVSGNKITGAYQSPLAQAEVLLEGEINFEQKNRFEIKEFDQGGNHVGTLRGNMGFEKSFTGDWINKGGNLHAPFDLKTRKETFTLAESNQRSSQNISVEFRTAQLETPSKSCQLIDHYLVFNGFGDKAVQKNMNQLFKPAPFHERQSVIAKCDETLQDLAFEKGSITEKAWTINALSEGLISVTSHVSDFNPLTKETTFSSLPLNLDPQTGKKLTNEDLLVANYQDQLNELVKQKLSEKYDHDWGIEFKGIGKDHSLAFYTDKVLIYFNPYELGKFAPGQIVLHFSYGEIGEFVNNNGPIGSLFPVNAAAQISVE